MQNTWLITGPPRLRKNKLDPRLLPETPWRLRLSPLKRNPTRGPQQGHNAGIDSTWLKDQIPELVVLETTGNAPLPTVPRLVLIEVQQFQPPASSEPDGIDPYVLRQLEGLNLRPDRALHFGLNPELPTQDVLDFKHLESWHHNLQGCAWDPNSLNSFWFELVNGAYGDVYRAKALMNLPDGRSFLCNWIVSQQNSQFLPLEAVEPPIGRPNRTSHLVVQGRALNPAGIQSTIIDCLLTDDVLELHQAPLRNRQLAHQSNR